MQQAVICVNGNCQPLTASDFMVALLTALLGVFAGLTIRYVILLGVAFFSREGISVHFFPCCDAFTIAHNFWNFRGTPPVSIRDASLFQSDPNLAAHTCCASCSCKGCNIPEDKSGEIVLNSKS